MWGETKVYQRAKVPTRPFIINGKRSAYAKLKRTKKASKMAIEQHQELHNSVRDPRTIDARVLGFLAGTNVTTVIFAGMALLLVIYPWTVHISIWVALFWWAGVAFDEERSVLPLFLPKEVGRKDLHNRKESGKGYKNADGIFFLGNGYGHHKEVWETSSFARQHKLIFGTTGAGKTELLTGLYVNFLVVGAGVIYSDAKGTNELISSLFNVARRFGRDDDFFVMNYSTGGATVREGRRTRLTNTCNPTGFASADQIVQMFSAFLPKSSGDNQIFQERAVAMITAVVPCLVDLRDLHGETLGVELIRDYVTSLHRLCDLAFDAENKLTEKAKSNLHIYLAGLPNFSVDEFLNGSTNMGKWPDYQINQEAGRMFGYASQYFMRALASLSDTYGHIYLTPYGEVDYRDIVLNRRIIVISLPALEKSPQELLSLAKINLSNIRGAISIGLGIDIEGSRKDILDNGATVSEFPTGIILDEYGYQSTDGFAITLAQARGLNFSITIAGQDLSNLEMGSKDEAAGIFGNATLITLNVKNVKEVGEKITAAVGETDVMVSSGADKVHAGPLSGYIEKLGMSVQRRFRVTPSDLLALEIGEAFMFAGKGIGTFKFRPWAPLPNKSDHFQINRYLPIEMPKQASDSVIKAATEIDKLLVRRLHGENRPAAASSLVAFSSKLLAVVDHVRNSSIDRMDIRYREAILFAKLPSGAQDQDFLVGARSEAPLTNLGQAQAATTASDTATNRGARVSANTQMLAGDAQRPVAQSVRQPTDSPIEIDHDGSEVPKSSRTSAFSDGESDEGPASEAMLNEISLGLVTGKLPHAALPGEGGFRPGGPEEEMTDYDRAVAAATARATGFIFDDITKARDYDAGIHPPESPEAIEAKVTAVTSSVKSLFQKLVGSAVGINPPRVPKDPSANTGSAAN